MANICQVEEQKPSYQGLRVSRNPNKGNLERKGGDGKAAKDSHATGSQGSGGVGGDRLRGGAGRLLSLGAENSREGGGGSRGGGGGRGEEARGHRSGGSGLLLLLSRGGAGAAGDGGEGGRGGSAGRGSSGGNLALIVALGLGLGLIAGLGTNLEGEAVLEDLVIRVQLDLQAVGLMAAQRSVNGPAVGAEGAVNASCEDRVSFLL
jgi:hypothetical protein